MSISARDSQSMTSGFDPVLDDVIEEMANRLQAGEPVDGAAILAKYPDRADSIRRLLPAMEVMAEFGVSASRLAAAGVSPGLSPLTGELGTLGDFRILREVGRGGMGIVYEAEQLSLGRRVALKVLPFAGAMDPQHLRRFRTEAQAAAQLHHTNIVPVYWIGCENGVHYYAMQFIEGRTLADVIRELRQLEGKDRRDEASREGEAPAEPASPGALASPGAIEEARREARPPGGSPGGLPSPDPPDDLAASALASALTQEFPPPAAREDVPPPAAALGPPDPSAGRTSAPPSGSSTRNRAYFRNVARLGLEAAEALEHAHQEGIVHRDIKPANLMVDARGHLWATDFGLARLQNDSGLTVTGDVLGTLRYMSPEQAMGKRAYLDHRTDIYSLGVTLYELLTLEPAFGSCDRAKLLRRIADEEPRAPWKLDDSVPRELETIVLKAMAKEPASRYQSAQELADDLRRFLEHKPIRARRPSIRELIIKWGRRHPSAIISALCIVIVLAAGLLVGAVLIARERDVAQSQRRIAETRARQARDAVDTMYTQVAETWISRQPALEPVQEEFLRAAARFYESFGDESGSDPRVRQETARAAYRLGKIELKLGRNSQADAALRRAIEIQQALAMTAPEDIKVRKDLADSLHALAPVCQQFNRREEGLRLLQQALGIRETLAKARPDDRGILRDLAVSLSRVYASYSDDGCREQASPLLYRSLEIRKQLCDREDPDPEDLCNLAYSYGNLSSYTSKMGRGLAAEAPGRRCIEIFESLVREHPSDPWYRYELVNAIGILGEVLWRMGRRDEAMPLAERARELSERVAAESPDVPDFRHRVADTYDNLARFHWEAGRYAEAIRARRMALDQHVILESRHPERDYEKHIAQNQRYRAMMLAGCPDVRLRDPREAVRLAQAAVDILPSGGHSWCVLGEARYRSDDWEGAAEALEKSLALDDDRIAVRTHLLLAMANFRRGHRDDAHRSYQEARAASNSPQSADRPPRRYRHGVDRCLDLFFCPEASAAELTRLQAEAESFMSQADGRHSVARKEKDSARTSKP